MRRTSFADVNCSVAQCLEVVGERWTPLIIRDALLGVTRFEDFRERLGIARNVLTLRLEQLVEDGILMREPYQDKPIRYDYRLTDKGLDLWHVIGAMREWGDRWSAPAGPPVTLVHLGCGGDVRLRGVCDGCGEIVERTSVIARPGPGAREGAPLPL
ncbi:winged helix-turn-helix transcriptional regulator [Tsukamurella soli]|uniref:Helix-turn-helix domain-containing protein n=1 Tax=Tsukamurella soli TaxID=644556 RepID=A0ABP8J6B2_9ACTN